ncbi:cytochrome c maturation protein CcmE [Thiorhodococcus mannitoliphagus]|uniref:Cytochrome c-type biogenesis protein CcmE n=1 Tax=Thiorhodococcus mannitoliphagus TaxID=329406 RepID=A0A6P1E541_9GAMM|nr:cytochrome c maturation protein CcmE [Thiorhodococcus mannitoliphagus]NEX23144.1 cytochrome c maturation protein CcmE [Thiorhodococcus mannitoliphagus]
MKARHKRLTFVGLAILGVGAASALALTALKGNISYFFSPSQVAANEAPPDHVFRLGGLVTEGSMQRQEDGLTIHFDVTDNAETVKVAYTGILPDLFSEGSGVVAKGRLGPNGIFYADEVLAKHDEEYMPPEVASTLKTAHAEGVANAATSSAEASN